MRLNQGTVYSIIRDEFQGHFHDCEELKSRLSSNIDPSPLILALCLRCFSAKSTVHVAISKGKGPSLYSIELCLQLTACSRKTVAESGLLMQIRDFNFMSVRN